VIVINESEIIEEIEKQVKTYSNWTIGITADPDDRRTEHGNPKYWKQ